jgi:hypothetical protein
LPPNDPGTTKSVRHDAPAESACTTPHAKIDRQP